MAAAARRAVLAGESVRQRARQSSSALDLRGFALPSTAYALHEALTSGLGEGSVGSSLLEIDVSRTTGWTIEHVTVFLSWLSQSTVNLERLVWQESGLTGDMLREIGRFIARGAAGENCGVQTYPGRGGCSLQALDVSFNHVGDDGVVAFFQEFVASLLRYDDRLRMAGVPLQPSTLGYSPTRSADLGTPSWSLRQLCLAGVGLNDGGILATSRAVLQILHRGQMNGVLFPLSSLNLASNHLTDRSIYCLAHLLYRAKDGENLPQSPSFQGAVMASLTGGKEPQKLALTELKVDDNLGVTTKGLAALLGSGDPSSGGASSLRKVSFAGVSLDATVYGLLSSIATSGRLCLASVNIALNESQAQQMVLRSTHAYAVHTLRQPQTSDTTPMESWILSRQLVELSTALRSEGGGGGRLTLMAGCMSELHRTVFSACVGARIAIMGRGEMPRTLVSLAENTGMHSSALLTAQYDDCHGSLAALMSIADVLGLPYVTDLTRWIEGGIYEDVSGAGREGGYLAPLPSGNVQVRSVATDPVTGDVVLVPPVQTPPRLGDNASGQIYSSPSVVISPATAAVVAAAVAAEQGRGSAARAVLELREREFVRTRQEHTSALHALGSEIRKLIDEETPATTSTGAVVAPIAKPTSGDLGSGTDDIADISEALANLSPRSGGLSAELRDVLLDLNRRLLGGSSTDGTVETPPVIQHVSNPPQISTTTAPSVQELSPPVVSPPLTPAVMAPQYVLPVVPPVTQPVFPHTPVNSSSNVAPQNTPAATIHDMRDNTQEMVRQLVTDTISELLRKGVVPSAFNGSGGFCLPPPPLMPTSYSSHVAHHESPASSGFYDQQHHFPMEGSGWRHPHHTPDASSNEKYGHHSHVNSHHTHPHIGSYHSHPPSPPANVPLGRPSAISFDGRSASHSHFSSVPVSSTHHPSADGQGNISPATLPSKLPSTSLVASGTVDDSTALPTVVLSQIHELLARHSGELVKSRQSETHTDRRLDHMEKRIDRIEDLVRDSLRPTAAALLRDSPLKQIAAPITSDSVLPGVLGESRGGLGVATNVVNELVQRLDVIERLLLLETVFPPSEGSRHATNIASANASLNRELTTPAHQSLHHGSAVTDGTTERLVQEQRTAREKRNAILERISDDLPLPPSPSSKPTLSTNTTSRLNSSGAVHAPPGVSVANHAPHNNGSSHLNRNRPQSSTTMTSTLPSTEGSIVSIQSIQALANDHESFLPTPRGGVSTNSHAVSRGGGITLDARELNMPPLSEVKHVADNSYDWNESADSLPPFPYTTRGYYPAIHGETPMRTPISEPAAPVGVHDSKTMPWTGNAYFTQRQPEERRPTKRQSSSSTYLLPTQATNARLREQVSQRR